MDVTTTRKTQKGGFFKSTRKKFIKYFLTMLRIQHRIFCIQKYCNLAVTRKCKKMDCDLTVLSIEEQIDMIYKKYQKQKPENETEYNKFNIIMACIASSCMTKRCKVLDIHYRKQYIDTILKQYFAFSETGREALAKVQAAKKKYQTVTDTIVKNEIDIFSESTFHDFRAFYRDYISKNKIT